MASAFDTQLSTISANIKTAQASIASLGALVPGSPGLATATTLLTGPADALEALATSAAAAMGTVTGAASLASITDAAGVMAQAVTAWAYLGRALKNLA